MDISKLVRKYNNHTAMNQAQKAFTYVDSFAQEIREITGNRFFLDVYIHAAVTTGKTDTGKGCGGYGCSCAVIQTSTGKRNNTGL